jgi:phospholipid N-methyltransferase
VNRIHNVLCSSGWWARRAEQELVPFGVAGVELGDDVLEVGPGFGATTRVLVERLARLSVLELDPRYCERLRADGGSTGSGVCRGALCIVCRSSPELDTETLAPELR